MISKYNLITIIVSACALFCSISAFYFQFFHKHYDVNASLIGGSSDNENYVYDIAFTNGGNQNVIITELSRFADIKGSGYKKSSFYDSYYLDTDIKWFVLHPGDVLIKTIKFPFKLREEMLFLEKEGIVVIEFGLAIIAVDTNGNWYRSNLIIPEARDFGAQKKIAAPGRSPPSVNIVTSRSLIK